jgi:hypothetical protein
MALVRENRDVVERERKLATHSNEMHADASSPSITLHTRLSEGPSVTTAQTVAVVTTVMLMKLICNGLCEERVSVVFDVGQRRLD